MSKIFAGNGRQFSLYLPSDFDRYRSRGIDYQGKLTASMCQRWPEKLKDIEGLEASHRDFGDLLAITVSPKIQRRFSLPTMMRIQSGPT
jgi:hypothetical protein